jgi:hypothetical protein
MLISQKRSFILSGRRAKGNPIARRHFARQTVDGQVTPEKIQNFCESRTGNLSIGGKFWHKPLPFLMLCVPE